MTELATLKVTENGYPVLLAHFKYILSHYGDSDRKCSYYN